MDKKDNQDRPYFRYFSNSRQAGEEERKKVLEKIGREEYGEVYIVPCSGCSTLQYSPKGRDGHSISYYSTSDINALLFSIEDSLESSSQNP